MVPTDNWTPLQTNRIEEIHEFWKEYLLKLAEKLTVELHIDSLIVSDLNLLIRLAKNLAESKADIAHFLI
jgi:hypothetical protein